MHHLTSAWRTITSHKLYALINVLGLGLGICACIVIYTITRYELTFDRFHPGAQRIYRVMEDVRQSWGEVDHFGKLPYAVPTQAAPTGAEIAGVLPFHPDATAGGKTFATDAVIAQPSWFSVFTYRWLAGKPSTDPFTVVLTANAAAKYFGRQPASQFIGRTITYDSIPMKVTGIIEDWTGNTDLGYTDFISFATLRTGPFQTLADPASWVPHDMPMQVFAKLSEGVAPHMIEAQLKTFLKRHTDIPARLWLEPLSDIHFNADVIENRVRTAHRPTLYALMGIALFILAIALINFINLSTAQSIRRSKEVGIRKVLGGGRATIMVQFLTETLLLALAATVVALLLVKPVLSAFKAYLPPGVAFHPFTTATVTFLLSLLAGAILLAGWYPARVLAAYLPAMTLKDAKAGKGGPRKVLIVFQFVISVAFIIGSIVMAAQLSYIRHKDLGFKTDAVAILETPRADSLSKVPVLAEALRNLPGVEAVARQWVPPGNAAGMTVRFDGSGDVRAAQVDGNEDFIPLYRIKLLAGRNLAHADSVNEFVINQSLSRLMGCKTPAAAVGKTIYWLDRPYPVVGVVADFHSQSLHAPITPACIINRVGRERALAIQLRPGATIQPIEAAWKVVYPGQTFDIKFYDETIALQYEADRRTAGLVDTAMGIAIFISCIGLFGLALFSSEIRTKEIGIRKVLGASVADITLLLNRDFVFLVAIGFVIASPLAAYAMNRWLDGFAYHITIGWWVFALAGLIALGIALATVSYQALRAALRNPVEALRTE